MANLSFTVPDAALPRLVDAFCGTFGYKEVLVNGQANPLSRQQFTRDQVRVFMQRIVIEWETKEAAALAVETASAKATSEVAIG